MMKLSRRYFFTYMFATAVLSACGQANRSHVRKLPKGATVLALGDSLTFGYGAASGADYPTQLADITGWRVVNGGVSGDTSGQALARLPELLRSSSPKLVLVSIGGNDFLQKLPEQETRVNISKIIQMIQSENVAVVLVAIPYFTTGALLGNVQEHELYQDLAKQYHVPLFKGAWAEILGDKDLKSDQIHANERGYRQFAEKMANFLKKQGFR